MELALGKDKLEPKRSSPVEVYWKVVGAGEEQVDPNQLDRKARQLKQNFTCHLSCSAYLELLVPLDSLCEDLNRTVNIFFMTIHCH